MDRDLSADADEGEEWQLDMVDANGMSIFALKGVSVMFLLTADG